MDACWTNVEHDIVWRIRIDGPCLNAARVARLREEVRTAISAGAQNLIVDLERIDRLDPWGLAGLASLPKEMPPSVRMVLAALQPAVLEAALLVHLHDVVDVYEDARAAVFDLSTPMNNP